MELRQHRGETGRKTGAKPTEEVVGCAVATALGTESRGVMTMQRHGSLVMVMVLPMVTGTYQVQYRQNIASRAENNPPV